MNERSAPASLQALPPQSSCCSDSSCCPPSTPFVRQVEKVGRNDPCPCDSGRKYKKCCGKS
ncbi:MAG: SEC-C metal-binding domain-containing protein [Pseudomonadota bacterium]